MEKYRSPETDGNESDSSTLSVTAVFNEGKGTTRTVTFGRKSSPVQKAGDKKQKKKGEEKTDENEIDDKAPQLSREEQDELDSQQSQQFTDKDFQDAQGPPSTPEVASKADSDVFSDDGLDEEFNQINTGVEGRNSTKLLVYFDPESKTVFHRRFFS